MRTTQRRLSPTTTRGFWRLGLALALAATSVVAVVPSATGAETGRGNGGSPGGSGDAPGIVERQPEGVSADQLIVTYETGAEPLDNADLGSSLEPRSRRRGVAPRNLRRGDRNTQIVSLGTEVDDDDLEAVMQQIAEQPGVAMVEPNLRLYPTTNDPVYPAQWDLTDPSAGDVGIDIEPAWEITTGSSDIYVAVIDSGSMNHPDLAGRFIGGYDFISSAARARDGDGRDADATDAGSWVTAAENRVGVYAGCGVADSNWHGTHVAGTIGAATNNGEGIAGINQVSQIVPIRVLGACGGDLSDVTDAIRWAAGLRVAGVPDNRYPARVINLSLGGPGACTASFRNAINAATAAGAVVIVSAGNETDNASGYVPANCPGVITVAATGVNGGRASYSNFGATIEIAAPGGDGTAQSGERIISTLNSSTRRPDANGMTYAWYAGTSMAAPHVAGVASLLLSFDPSLTPTMVLDILQRTATPFPAACGACGAGILNAAAALEAWANPGGDDLLAPSAAGYGTYGTNDAGRRLSQRASGVVPAGAEVIETADFDGDGDDELVFADLDGEDGPSYSVFEATADGAPGEALATDVAVDEAYDELLAGDWDGDGDDELAFIDRRDGQRPVYDTFEGTATGELGDPLVSSVGFESRFEAVFAGDWDGDGDDEIVFVDAEYSTRPAYIVFDTDDDGKFVSIRRGFTSYSPIFETIRSADVDGDGDDEFMFIDADGQSASDVYWVFEGNADGAFGSILTGNEPMPAGSSTLVFGDFDGS